MGHGRRNTIVQPMGCGGEISLYNPWVMGLSITQVVVQQVGHGEKYYCTTHDPHKIPIVQPVGYGEKYHCTTHGSW
jgi:hypothetical protein